MLRRLKKVEIFVLTRWMPAMWLLNIGCIVLIWNMWHGDQFPDTSNDYYDDYNDDRYDDDDELCVGEVACQGDGTLLTATLRLTAHDQTSTHRICGSTVRFCCSRSWARG